MKNKKLRGFTLVELMVAMAIIAVLIGLSAFGISTLQRLSRDNQRRQTMINVQTMIEGYYNDFFIYPEQSELDVSTGSIGIVDYNQAPVTLSGPTLVVNGASNLSGSRYCYNILSDGYKLGIQLESGEFFNVGTASQQCTPSDTADFLIP